MGTSMQIGMALATPVKPDILGERLEAYAKVLPILKTLRLCHRSGQGPAAHVTKLPKELELAIEEIIIREKQQNKFRYWSDWRSAFRHYEGRCAPMDHVDDVYSPLSDQASDHLKLCKKCEENYMYPINECENICDQDTKERCWTCLQTLDPENCQRTCDAEQSDLMNTMILDWEMYLEVDDDVYDREEWETMINQSETGAFAKYDKILREHFGLEVLFSPTRMATEEREMWPRSRNRKWHSEEDIKTTICYLTKAKKLAPEKTYEQSEVEVECDIGLIHTTQAVAIKPSAAKVTEDASKRFGRAMNILDLEPYVHPSQADGLPVNAGDWPQQLLLVKSSAHFGWA